MTMCFVDTMSPASPVQAEGWECFLSLRREHWREARIMFRKVYRGSDPAEALAQFVEATSFHDEPMRLRLEAALAELSKEARG